MVVSRGGEWERHVVTLHSAEVGAWAEAGSDRIGRHPTTISFAASSGAPWIDIDNVQLTDAAADRSLLKNGDFSQGGDYWFFTSDDHVAWRVFNLVLQLYFEQGFLGVAALVVLLSIVFARNFPLARQGDSFAALSCIALFGVLLVGLFGSLLDTPRLALLFYLLAIVALFHRDSGRIERLK